MEVHQIFIYMIFNLLVEQNKQLLKIIADEEGLDYKTLVISYVPTRHSFTEFMKSYQSSSSSSSSEE
jgi:hypothetical protein